MEYGQPKDPSKKHFIISLVKSVWRLIASALLIYAGYMLWNAGDSGYALISEAGYLIMLAGGGLSIAELLGIWEEL